MEAKPKFLTAALDEKGEVVPFWFVDTRTKHPYLIYRQTISGQRFKISTGEIDLKLARIAVNKHIKEFFAKSPEQREKEKKRASRVKLLNADLMPEFLSKQESLFRSEAVARGTWTAYRAAHNRVYTFYREFFPDEHTKDLWDQFQDWAEQKWPGQVQFNYLKYMRKYEGWLVEKGLLSARLKISNKFKRRETIKRKRKKFRVFTREELVRLRRATPVKHRVIFDLGFEMAFRIGDCVSLSWDRCDFKKGDLPVIHFRYGDDKSTKNDITVPVSDNVYRALLALQKEAGGQKDLSPWVFPQVTNKERHIAPQQFDWPLIRRTAKVNYGTFHTLRHTRLTLDFSNPEYTSTQVMLVRRVSYEVAREHYIHVGDKDLRLLRNPKNDGLG